MALEKADYINLIENTYFGNVAKAELEKVLDCFTDDALTTIRHGDNPLRLFRKLPEPGELYLGDFYSHLCGNFNAWFGDFTHYIDAESGYCASKFTVKLNPREDSDYFSAGPQTLNNCNFFTYKHGKITDMTIYYSNTGAGESSGGINTTPTGYPKQK